MSTSTSRDDDLPVLDPDEPSSGSWWSRVDKTLLAVAVVVAIGLTFVVRGVLVGVTGDERAALPDELEEIDPVPGAVRVLAQTSVFVDLQTGYTGRLVIDGVEIETIGIDELANADLEPGQQVSVPPVTIYEPGNATLTFTPAAGAPIEEFGEGIHEATVIYWRIEDGPERSRSYTWTFNTV
ncbi:MAG: hypothetical protein ACLGHQ_08065 [Acidimicrobiia bacterium]